MGSFPSVNLTCERARAWASLELDGQLSELEAALLGAHLASCPPCAAVVVEMRAFTGALRSAPAETPSRPLFVPAGRRSVGRRRSLAVRVAAAAAAAALAAGLGALAGSRSERPAPPPRTSSDIAILPFEPPGESGRRDRSEPLPPRVGGL